MNTYKHQLILIWISFPVPREEVKNLGFFEREKKKRWALEIKALL